MKSILVLLLVACAAGAFALNVADFNLNWKMDLSALTGLHYHHDTFRVPNARESTDLMNSALNLTVSAKELIPKPSPLFPCEWLVDTMVGEKDDGGMNFVQFADCPDWFPNVQTISFEHMTFLVHHVDYINVVINYLITKHRYTLEIPLMCDPGNAVGGLPGEPKCESCVVPPEREHGFTVCIGAFTPVVAMPPPPPMPAAPETAPAVQSVRVEGGLTPTYAMRGHAVAYRHKTDRVPERTPAPTPAPQRV